MRRLNNKKAILKTITWRSISSISFFFIVLFWSDSYKLAGSLTLVDAVVKTVLYYIHELAWQGRGKFL